MNRSRALANQVGKTAAFVMRVFPKIVSLLTLNINRDLMGKIGGQSYSSRQLVNCKSSGMETSGQGCEDARVRAVAPWAIVLPLGLGLLLASSLAPWHPVLASTQTINVQGKVTNTDGTNVADGVYDFSFSLYDGAGSGASTTFTESWTSGALWSSTMSSAPSAGGTSLTYSSGTNEASIKAGQMLWNTTKQEAVTVVSVNTGTNTVTISPTRQAWNTADTVTNQIYVKDGIFQAALNSLNQNWGTTNFSNDLYLGVTFNNDGEMKPRSQFSSVPHSFRADSAASVDGLSIAGGKSVTFQNSLTLSGTDGTAFVLPTASTTLVGTDSAQTLTNKTITTSGLLTASNGFTLSGGALSLPSNAVTDAMVSNTLTSSIFIGSGSTTSAIDLATGEVAGTLPNSNLTGSGALTVTAGNGMTGGGSVTLGGSTSLAVGAGTGISVGSTSVSLDFSGTLAGNPALSAGQGMFASTGLIFEGSSADNNETLLTFTNPTADRTIAFPNASGTVAVSASGNIALSAAGAISFTGTLPIANGGTNSTATPTAGGVAYGTGSAFAFTVAGSNGQCLQSNGLSAPTWGTCYSIGTDSLDFDDFADALTLDASTSIALGSNTLSTSGTGGITFGHTGATTFAGMVTSSGLLTASNGFTLSSGALSLPNNSVTDAMVSNTLTSSIFIGSGSTTNAVDLASAEAAGVLTIAKGGTNSTDTPTNGGIAYGTGSAFAFSAAGSPGQCLQSNGGGAPSWGECDSSSSLFTDGGAFTYLTSMADDLVIGGNSAASGSFLMDVSTGSLYLGTDGSLNGGLVFRSSATGLSASIFTDNTGNLTLNSAAGGTVVVGGGSGNIELLLSEEGDVLAATKAVSSLSGAYANYDFSFTRNLAGGANNLSGAVVKIADTSSSSGTIANDMLLIDAAPSSGSFTGNLINAKVAGTSKFSVSSTGAIVAGGGITLNGGLSVGAASILDGSGVLQSAGLSGTYGNALTFSNSITIGSGGNTTTISSTGLTFSGTARPVKTITLSPEFPNSTFITDGSADTNGTMTSENTGSGSGWRNYYEWSSTQATLQDYTIAVRVTLPQDFDVWDSNAFSLSYQTGTASTADNAISAEIIESTQSVAACSLTTDRASTSWTTTNMTCADTTFNDGSNDWDTAGQTAIIKIKVKAKNTASALARVGDIVLKYKSRF